MSNTRYTYQSASGGGGNFSIIPILLIGIALLLGFFFLARFIFNILYYLAPVLIIITLILDYKTVVNYGKWIWSTMGKNPLLGVGLVLLTILGFPVVSLFLFGKAMLKKRIRDMRKDFEEQQTGEYIEYEEVSQKTKQRIELPPPPRRMKEKQQRGGTNEYENLFE